MGDGEGSIEEDEKQMIASIFEMGETVVREIMSPRIDIIALAVDTPLAEALDVIIKAGHSRIPVFEDNADRIVGFLYAKDLLKCFRDKQTDVPIRSILRSAYLCRKARRWTSFSTKCRPDGFISPLWWTSMAAPQAWSPSRICLRRSWAKSRTNMTRNLRPTRRSPGYLCLQRPAGCGLGDGSAGIYPPYADVDTLGGFIFAELGHVPETGETVTYAGFTVLSVESRASAKCGPNPRQAWSARTNRPRPAWNHPVLVAPTAKNRPMAPPFPVCKYRLDLS